MSEQVEIAKEWLSERCDASYHGKICAYALKEYIAELEAEVEQLKADSGRLDALDGSSKEQCLAFWDKWYNEGFDVREVIDELEKHHE